MSLLKDETKYYYSQIIKIKNTIFIRINAPSLLIPHSSQPLQSSYIRVLQPPQQPPPL